MHTVLRTIPSYFPLVSGPANQARAIAQGLTDDGYDSLLLTTTLGAESAPRSELLDGVAVRRVPTEGGLMQYRIALRVWPALQQRAALIHAHCYRNFLTDAAAVTARQRGLPLVLHLHGTLLGYRQIARHEHWWRYQAYDMLARPLGALQADRVIVSTDEERGEALACGVAPQRIAVIPMGIDPADYSFAGARDPQRIVFVGRLTEDRNPELLLRALAALRDLPWSCTLVGAEVRRSFTTAAGYADQLRQLAADLGIAERVTFAGQQHGAALRRAYAQAGIFVYPSRYENFGQTILEAAAAGCALLTTAVGVAHDLVRDDVTGYRIAADAHEPLAQHLRRLLARPALQAAMGEAARRLVCSNYAWAPILRRYADLYDAVLDERRMPRRLRGAMR